MINQINGPDVRRLLVQITAEFEQKKEYLSSLDAQLGDGDHGFSLARGCRAGAMALAALPAADDVPDVLFRAYGRALTCEIGGAMGPLFGLIFTQLGTAARGKETLDLVGFATGLTAARDQITKLGGAKAGDKTMVDAILPAVEALIAAVDRKDTLVQGLVACAQAAHAGAEATIPMVARLGRSKYMREGTIGHQDAGATSFYTLMQTIADFARENVA